MTWSVMSDPKKVKGRLMEIDSADSCSSLPPEPFTAAGPASTPSLSASGDSDKFTSAGHHLEEFSTSSRSGLDTLTSGDGVHAGRQASRACMAVESISDDVPRSVEAEAERRCDRRRNLPHPDKGKSLGLDSSYSSGQETLLQQSPAPPFKCGDGDSAVEFGVLTPICRASWLPSKSISTTGTKSLTAQALLSSVDFSAAGNTGSLVLPPWLTVVNRRPRVVADSTASTQQGYRSGIDTSVYEDELRFFGGFGQGAICPLPTLSRLQPMVSNTSRGGLSTTFSCGSGGGGSKQLSIQ